MVFSCHVGQLIFSEHVNTVCRTKRDGAGIWDRIELIQGLHSSNILELRWYFHVMLVSSYLLSMQTQHVDLGEMGLVFRIE